MIKGYQFAIALRYLKVRNRELFISLISWISVGGVAIGVAALIVVMSVMAGFEREIKEKILGANSHCRVTSSDGETLADWKAVADAARETNGVSAASPYVDGRVMLMSGQSVQGVELKGIDPADHEGTSLKKYLLGGDPSKIDEGSHPGLYLGREMALNWGVGRGDLVRLVSTDPSVTPAGLLPRFRVFRVAGFFTTGMYEYDTGRVYISMGQARDFLRLGDGVSGVEVRFEEILRAREISESLRARLGDRYLVRDWTQMNKTLFGALSLEKLAMHLILGLIMIVAAFNIASTLTMVVMDKARDIGILMSMGLGRDGVRNVFLVEGMVIGSIGATGGCLLGLGLAWGLKKFEFIKLPQDVYYNANLPVVLDPVFIATVMLISLVLCLAASWYPSWRAARLDPVEALRFH